MISAAPRTCPACHAAPRRSYRLRNGCDLLRCPRCLLGWWEWPAFDPTQFYDASYFQSGDGTKGYGDYASMEAGVRRTARARLRRIDRLLRARPQNGVPRRLVEFGCGTGCFLDEAAKAGWECLGFEVSAYAASRAAARGLHVRCGPIEELRDLPKNADCVAMWDVIEHVRDPAAVLRAAAAALRPGGVLALSTGDITSLCARLTGPAWHLFNLPEHLYFFSPQSLHRLFADAGCLVVLNTREVNWVPLSYVVERLTRSVGRNPPSVSTAATCVVPATLLDVLGLYARNVGVDHRGLT